MTSPNTIAVRQGDTLETIAFRVYGDSTLWRVIAQANDLRDPAVVQVGQVLRLPR